MSPQVDLGDRPVQITLVRTWAALSLWQKVKLVFSLVYSGINVPDAEELAQMVEELKARHTPPAPHPPCSACQRRS